MQLARKNKYSFACQDFSAASSYLKDSPFIRHQDDLAFLMPVATQLGSISIVLLQKIHIHGKTYAAVGLIFSTSFFQQYSLQKSKIVQVLSNIVLDSHLF